MGQTNDKVKARSSNGRAPAKASRFDGARFVQYELDEAQKAQCKAWGLSESDCWLAVLPLLDDGYSLTVKFDTYSEAYAAFLQVRGQADHVNSGLVLSGRGSSAYKAVKQLLFKLDAIGPSWVQYAERRVQDLDD